MKPLKANLAGIACGLLLAAMSARAQTTWNFVISPAFVLDSQITWSVTGSLATPPGQVLPINESSLAISLVAPGLFASTYSENFTASIPSPDGSSFQYYPGNVYAAINEYSVNTAAGNGNQSFGLVAPLLPNSVGMSLLYTPGTQSDIIRLPFSDFNPGTYQSVETVFSSPITVNLTVVPEPSFAGVSGRGDAQRSCSGKNEEDGSRRVSLRGQDGHW
jgi:hypothetical protein